MTALACGGFGWTMHDEREFIRNLGTHRHESPRILATFPPRAEILRGYIAGMELRTDWGQLDREALRIFALQELLVAEGKVSLSPERSSFAEDVQ